MGHVRGNHFEDLQIPMQIETNVVTRDLLQLIMYGSNKDG